MKKSFNKAASNFDELRTYTIRLNETVTAEGGREVYHQAMDRSQRFAAYVNGWAVGNGYHKTGDFFACFTGTPTKDGKEDVINGNQPNITINCTSRVMRRFQAEFSTLVADITYKGLMQNLQTKGNKWLHPRKDAADRKTPHFLISNRKNLR